MSDPIDRAQEREAEMLRDALAEQQRRTGWRADGQSAELCRICDDPIPALRRKYLPGVETCVDCQSDLERGLQS